MADSDKPHRSVSDVRIGRLPRLLIGLAGIASCGCGGLATFWTSNQAGSAGLMVVGVLAGVVAARGSVPSQFMYGDTSVDWSEQIAGVSEAAAAALEADGPLPDEQAERLERIPIDHLPPSNALRPVLIEARVQQAITMIEPVLIKPDPDPDFDLVAVYASIDAGAAGISVRAAGDWLDSTWTINKVVGHMISRVKNDTEITGAILAVDQRILPRQMDLVLDVVGPPSRNGISVVDRVASKSQNELVGEIAAGLLHAGFPGVTAKVP